MNPTLLKWLPSSVQRWYAARLLRRLTDISLEEPRLRQLLEDVEPGYEYTEGFRAHVARRLDELATERTSIRTAVAVVDPEALYR